MTTWRLFRYLRTFISQFFYSLKLNAVLQFAIKNPSCLFVSRRMHPNLFMVISKCFLKPGFIFQAFLPNDVSRLNRNAERAVIVDQEHHKIELVSHVRKMHYLSKFCVKSRLKSADILYIFRIRYYKTFPKFQLFFFFLVVISYK